MGGCFERARPQDAEPRATFEEGSLRMMRERERDKEMPDHIETDRRSS